MAASSSEGDSRSKKLSYERARREIISDKFRELGELLVEYGYQKGDVLTQADALTATIAVMRKLLNKDPPTSSPPESEDRGDLKRSRGSSSRKGEAGGEGASDSQSQASSSRRSLSVDYDLSNTVTAPSSSSQAGETLRESKRSRSLKDSNRRRRREQLRPTKALAPEAFSDVGSEDAASEEAAHEAPPNKMRGHNRAASSSAALLSPTERHLNREKELRDAFRHASPHPSIHMFSSNLQPPTHHGHHGAPSHARTLSDHDHRTGELTLDTAPHSSYSTASSSSPQHRVTMPPQGSQTYRGPPPTLPYASGLQIGNGIYPTSVTAAQPSVMWNQPPQQTERWLTNSHPGRIQHQHHHALGSFFDSQHHHHGPHGHVSVTTSADLQLLEHADAMMLDASPDHDTMLHSPAAPSSFQDDLDYAPTDYFEHASLNF